MKKAGSSPDPSRTAGRNAKAGQSSADTGQDFSKVRLERIGEDDAGQRLDNYLLKTLKNIPKSKIYQIIRKGEVRLDKKRAKPSSKLMAGQVLRIPPLHGVMGGAVASTQVNLGKHQRQQAQLAEAILYEDEYLLVVNKPAGLAVHGGSGISMGLIELLRASRPEGAFLELVHRLDKDTSGCIVLAKRGAILRELHQLIRDGAIEKHYSALLAGRWRGERHLVEAPLQKFHLASGERIVRVSREGKASATLFMVRERFREASLVDAQLLTGRTHQIRVHSQHAGHPIIGDEKYGNEQLNQVFREKGFERMFLHAHSLSLPLSVYSSPLNISAPLGETLERLLASLREDARKDDLRQ